MRDSVVIIIVNYNCSSDTIECLRSLQDSTFTKFSVVVVDNHSTDDSVVQLSSFLSEVAPNFQLAFSESDFTLDLFEGSFYLIVSKDNNGFAAGNNLVLSQLTELDTYVWLLNPDVVVDPLCLHNLVADYQTAGMAALGSCIFDFRQQDKFLNFGAARIHWFSGTIRLIVEKEDLAELDFIYGASLFTTSRIFATYGLLPENYFLYWEETDFCYNLILNGEKLGISHGSKLYDKVGGSIGRGYLAFYYYARNGLLFVEKFKPGMIKYVLFFNLVRILKRLIFMEFRIAKAIFDGTVDFFRKGNR